MALINSEEAAKRLARVILSDIELYSRERPQAGENLDARIEEGRRLFGSRVSPSIVPLFDVVLADRRTAGAKAPTAAASFATRAGSAAVERSLDDDAPTPGPIALALADDPTPVSVVPPPPVPLRAAPSLAPKVAPPAVPPVLKVAPPAVPPVPEVTQAAVHVAPTVHVVPEVTPRVPIARARDARTPVVGQPAVAVVASVPPSAPSAAALSPAPAATDAPVPVLTSRVSISILKLLVLAAVVAAAAVLLCRYVRLTG